MTRRLAACVALVALVAGACGSSPPTLTDPKEIVAQSVATLQTMKSFHLHATAERDDQDRPARARGTRSRSISRGRPPTPTSTSRTARPRRSLSAQSLFLNADLVYTGTDAYYKVSLLGPKYKKLALADLLNLIPGAQPAAPSPLPSVVMPVGQPVGGRPVDPRLPGQADRAAGQGTRREDRRPGLLQGHDQAQPGRCRHERPQPGPAVARDGPVQRHDRGVGPQERPAARPGHRGGRRGASGNVTITIALSNIDAPVVIAPPPADQVEP